MLRNLTARRVVQRGFTGQTPLMKSVALTSTTILTLALSLFALTAGCSSPSDDSAPTDPAAEEQNLTKSDAGAAAAGKPWPEDGDALVAWSIGGGFGPQAPEGSECEASVFEYKVLIDEKMLKSQRCVGNDDGSPYRLVNAEKSLTNAQLTKILRAAKELKVVKGDACGADKPLLAVLVSSRSQGLMTYTDSFYGCLEGDRVFVDNIDELIRVLSEIAT